MILTSLSSGWFSMIKFAVAVGVLWSNAMWWKVPIQCNVFVAYRRSIVQCQRLHVSNFKFQVHSWRLFACWPQHSCGKRVQKEHSRTHKQSAWFEYEDAGNLQLFSKSHLFHIFFTFFHFCSSMDLIENQLKHFCLPKSFLKKSCVSLFFIFFTFHFFSLFALLVFFWSFVNLVLLWCFCCMLFLFCTLFAFILTLLMWTMEGRTDSVELGDIARDASSCRAIATMSFVCHIGCAREVRLLVLFYVLRYSLI